MPRQRLYIVHGMGSDAVGLVGNITTPIASAGGNIVDLRQDVLHGLFTIYMVVDLTDCELRIEAFKDIIKSIAEDTGLKLSVDTYHPVARNPDKKNILLILLGYDKPGIIASMSQTLGNYKANIDFANNIAREGIFLMELLIDVSYCTLPFENLKSVISQKMSEMGIISIFQTKDVFNKKKRVILFDITHSLISADASTEILQQAGLTPKELTSIYPRDNPVKALTKAAQLLEGLPADVLNTIADDIQVESGTTELLQTLKIMGYKISVACHGFSVFVETLAKKIGLDHCYCVELEINDDSRTVRGEIAAEKIASRSIDNIKSQVAQIEQVDVEDVSIVSDKELPEPLGLRIDLNLEKLLSMYNKHVISKDNLIGLLGSLGVQRV